MLRNAKDGKMAILTNIVRVNEQPNARTNVSGDYCFDKNYFQIRTYKAGDTNRTYGQKQNIQLDKDMAVKLITDLTHQGTKIACQ